MVEVIVHSVRVSLITQNRVVVLKEIRGRRYLPIWIGPYEADAIALRMQEVEMERPFTHDLLRAVIDVLGGKVTRVLVNDIRDNTYYARIIFDVDGRYAEVDSRPSDAIALAVRIGCPIFIEDAVLDQAGLTLEDESSEGKDSVEEGLDVFRDFFSQLDLEGPEAEGDPEIQG
jgi:bifunctional DNase/RNase